MQNVTNLPCILVRNEKSLSIFNMDLNYRIIVRNNIQFYKVEDGRPHLQVAYAGSNSKYPTSIQVLYIEHSTNPKNNEKDSRFQAMNIDSVKLQ